MRRVSATSAALAYRKIRPASRGINPPLRCPGRGMAPHRDRGRGVGRARDLSRGSPAPWPPGSDARASSGGCFALRPCCRQHRVRLASRGTRLRAGRGTQVWTVALWAAAKLQSRSGARGDGVLTASRHVAGCAPGRSIVPLCSELSASIDSTPPSRLDSPTSLTRRTGPSFGPGSCRCNQALNGVLLATSPLSW